MSLIRINDYIDYVSLKLNALDKSRDSEWDDSAAAEISYDYPARPIRKRDEISHPESPDSESNTFRGAPSQWEEEAREYYVSALALSSSAAAASQQNALGPPTTPRNIRCSSMLSFALSRDEGHDKVFRST